MCRCGIHNLSPKRTQRSKTASHPFGKLRGVVVDIAQLMCNVHGAVLAVVENRAAGQVDRQHAKVGADPVALCVVIRKKPAS